MLQLPPPPTGCTKPQPPCAWQPFEPLHAWNTVTGAHWLVPAFGPEAV